MSNLTPRLNDVESGNNIILNGAFDIWQRGVSFSAQFTADRWRVEKGGAVVMAYTRESDVPTPAESGFANTYCLKGNVSTIDASVGATDFTTLDYKIEGHDYACIHGGKQATLSFWFKCTTPGVYTASFKNADSTRSLVKTFTVDSANVWEKKVITFTTDTSGNWNLLNGAGLRISWNLVTGTTYQSPSLDSWESGNYFGHSSMTNTFSQTLNNNFYVTQIMLTPGSSAGVFRRAGKTISEELAMCQRYFQIIGNGTTGAMGSTNKQTGTTYRFNMSLATDMRSTPSVAFQGTAYVIQGVSGQSANQTAVPIVQTIQSGSILLERNVGVDHGVGIYVASIGEGRFQLNAEL